MPTYATITGPLRYQGTTEPMWAEVSAHPLTGGEAVALDDSTTLGPVVTTTDRTTGDFTLQVPLPASPEPVLWRIKVKPLTGKNDVQPWTAGVYEITAGAPLRQLVPTDVRYVSEELVMSITADRDAAEAAAAQAQAAQVAAQAAAALAVDISEIDTSDDAVDAVLKLPGGKAAGTLSASLGREQPSIKYPQRAAQVVRGEQRESVDQMTVLTFGDSYGQKLWQGMRDVFLRSFGGGFAGAMFAGNLGVTANTSSGTVTDTTTDYGLWITGMTTALGSGASVTYGVGGAATVCDTIVLTWLNAGGTLKFQVDGADAYTPTVTNDNSLGVHVLSVPRGAHVVQAVRLSGSPKIPTNGIGFVDSTRNGVVLINVSREALSLETAGTAQAWTNFATLLAATTPDLMLHEMKEGSVYGSGETYAEQLVKEFTATSTGAPQMTVVPILSTPVSSNDTDQRAQNTALAETASGYGYSCWDAYSIYGSYAAMLAMPDSDDPFTGTFAGDGTHRSGAADYVLGLMFMRDLGFLALGGTSPLDVRASLAQVLDHLTVGDVAAPVLDFYAEPFGLDGQTKIKRDWHFVKPDGTTLAKWSAGDNAGSPSDLPPWSRFGDGMAGLHAAASYLLDARRWDSGSMNGFGDFRARSYLRIPVAVTVPSGGAVTLDLGQGSVFLVTMAQNITSFNVTGIVAGGQSFEVQFIQGGTVRSVANGGNIRFANDAPPVAGTANRVDVYQFTTLAEGFARQSTAPALACS